MNISKIFFGGFVAIFFMIAFVGQDGGPVSEWTEEERQYLLSELERTKDELSTIVSPLTEEEWLSKVSPDTWSVAEIVEHLEVQEENYFREMFLVTNTKQDVSNQNYTNGKDGLFLAYATDPAEGNSGFALAAIGRFCTKQQTINAFVRMRDATIEVIKNTERDYRQYFTFRNYDGEGLSDPGLWDVRDLHQLMLTNIAHSDRHIVQIKKLLAISR